MIRRGQYDLCLIDMRTPEMSGKELYQWLQQEKPGLAGGAIFTTGDVMNEDMQAFLQRSGRPFLPKPFTPDELMSVVAEVLKRFSQTGAGEGGVAPAPPDTGETE